MGSNTASCGRLVSGSSMWPSQRRLHVHTAQAGPDRALRCALCTMGLMSHVTCSPTFTGRAHWSVHCAALSAGTPSATRTTHHTQTHRTGERPRGASCPAEWPVLSALTVCGGFLAALRCRVVRPERAVAGSDPGRPPGWRSELAAPSGSQLSLQTAPSLHGAKVKTACS